MPQEIKSAPIALPAETIPSRKQIIEKSGVVDQELAIEHQAQVPLPLTPQPETQSLIVQPSMATAAHTRDELDERYFALYALIEKRPDVNEIKKQIAAYLGAISNQKIISLPICHISNWTPQESKWQLYADITSAIDSGNWSKLRATEPPRMDEPQRRPALLTDRPDRLKSGLSGLKETYDKTIKGINDGIDTAIRLVFFVVKWVAITLLPSSRSRYFPG